MVPNIMHGDIDMLWESTFSLRKTQRKSRAWEHLRTHVLLLHNFKETDRLGRKRDSHFITYRHPSVYLSFYFWIFFSSTNAEPIMSIFFLFVIPFLSDPSIYSSSTFQLNSSFLRWIAKKIKEKWKDKLVAAEKKKKKYG